MALSTSVPSALLWEQKSLRQRGTGSHLHYLRAASGAGQGIRLGLGQHLLQRGHAGNMTEGNRPVKEATESGRECAKLENTRLV